MLRKDLAPHVLTASNCSQLISAFKYLGEMCEINQTGAWVGSIMSPSSGENHAFCGDTRYQAPDSFHRVTIRECASNRPAPMLPPAPVTFSMTTGWPSEVLMRSATMRASVSTGPPAANGTTIVIERDG